VKRAQLIADLDLHRVSVIVDFAPLRDLMTYIKIFERSRFLGERIPVVFGLLLVGLNLKTNLSDFLDQLVTHLIFVERELPLCCKLSENFNLLRNCLCLLPRASSHERLNLTLGVQNNVQFFILRGLILVFLTLVHQLLTSLF